LAARMKNGKATKVCAITTAVAVKVTAIPFVDNHSPSGPLRPKSMSNAKPVTIGGSTIGKSTRVSTIIFPRNWYLANMNARKPPKRITRKVEMVEVIKLIFSAFHNVELKVASTRSCIEDHRQRQPSGMTKKSIVIIAISPALPLKKVKATGNILDNF